jgi:3-oxoacyl-[acyl-carrier-protein] synthase III
VHSVTSTTPAPAWTPGVAPPRTAGIAALGVAVPEEAVPNAPIAERLGVDEDWIVARTGVRERRRAAPGETLDALAADAGRVALERAALEPERLDLVLVATTTAESLLPNAAPLVAGRLGATHAGAIDVGAACTGFLSGLALASAQVESGRADHVLLVGADLMTRVLDPDDRRTAALFGDGAGAALVSAGGPGLIGPVLQRADSTGAHCVTVGHDERLMRMRGQDTFRAAVARLSECTLQAAAAAELTLAEIDLFVYHQANGRILRAVGERLGLPTERVIDCTDSYGNTSAASVPIALAEADAAGMLQPGSRVLVGAFGAGFTWGAGVIEWGL